MCGILGFAGHVQEGRWGETHRILEAMFLASEHRGRDATGFCALSSPYKNQCRSKIIVEKQAEPVNRFIRQNCKWRALRHQRCSMLIGHVRMATHGDPNN